MGQEKETHCSQGEVVAAEWNILVILLMSKGEEHGGKLESHILLRWTYRVCFENICHIVEIDKKHSVSL